MIIHKHKNIGILNIHESVPQLFTVEDYFTCEKSGTEVEVYQKSWTMHVIQSYCSINAHEHAEINIINKNYLKKADLGT